MVGDTPDAGRAAGEPDPRLRSPANDLWLEFPFTPHDLAAVGVAENRLAPELTPEVGRMLAIINGEMNRTESMAASGLRDGRHFREHYQQAALAAGVLPMTTPRKPNGRRQTPCRPPVRAVNPSFADALSVLAALQNELGRFVVSRRFRNALSATPMFTCS